MYTLKKSRRISLLPPERWKGWTVVTLAYYLQATSKERICGVLGDGTVFFLLVMYRTFFLSLGTYRQRPLSFGQVAFSKSLGQLCDVEPCLLCSWALWPSRSLDSAVTCAAETVCVEQPAWFQSCYYSLQYIHAWRRSPLCNYWFGCCRYNISAFFESNSSHLVIHIGSDDNTVLQVGELSPSRKHVPRTKSMAAAEFCPHAQYDSPLAGCCFGSCFSLMFGAKRTGDFFLQWLAD